MDIILYINLIVIYFILLVNVTNSIKPLVTDQLVFILYLLVATMLFNDEWENYKLFSCITLCIIFITQILIISEL
jgi:hypothetical protein